VATYISSNIQQVFRQKKNYIQPVNTPPNNSVCMISITVIAHTTTTTLNLRLNPSATPRNGAVSRSAALYTQLSLFPAATNQKRLCRRGTCAMGWQLKSAPVCWTEFGVNKERNK